MGTDNVTATVTDIDTDIFTYILITDTTDADTEAACESCFVNHMSMMSYGMISDHAYKLNDVCAFLTSS